VFFSLSIFSNTFSNVHNFLFLSSFLSLVGFLSFLLRSLSLSLKHFLSCVLCFPIFLFYLLKNNIHDYFIIVYFVHTFICMFSPCLSDLDWITRIFAIFPFCFLLQRLYILVGFIIP